MRSWTAWNRGGLRSAAVAAAGLVTLTAAPSARAEDPPEVRGTNAGSLSLVQEHIVRGDQFLSSKLPEKAAAEYQKALEADPENGEAWSRLGYAYVQANNYEQAIKVYKRYAEEIDPKDCAARASLGYAYMRQDLTDQAIRAYEQALDLCPEDPNAFSNVAAAYKQGGFPLEAMEAYRRTIELNPSDVLAYETLASLYYERKLYPEAIATYEAILALPNHGKDEKWVAWASSRIARLYKWADAFEKAIPYYRRALEEDPTDDRILRALAICYEETGGVGEAIRLYQALVEQVPDKPVYYYRLGELLNDIGRYQEALRTVRLGKNYDTECPAHAHAVIGRALEKMGGIQNYKKAEREFRKCVECGDRNLTGYCQEQITRQQQLAEIEELKRRKEKQGY